MGRFRFPLERVQRVREIREEVARGELLLAERAVRAAQADLQRCELELVAAERELGDAQARAELEPDAVLAAQRTLPALARRIAVQRARLSAALTAADAARSTWYAARSDVRALDKLEERARQVHREEQAQRDDKVAQEIADRGAGASRPRDGRGDPS